jgi:CubicO group peptidase (beta-lactamase class C family)
MGGTGDMSGPEYERNRLMLHEHSDYVKLYGARAPTFEPGTRFEYSNYGFVLLGAVIEAVSGESYYDYVREHIFKPVGMTSTGSLPESVEVPRRSIPYMRPYDGAQSWQPSTDLLPWRGHAAGGGYSTVGDVARFADALTSNKLLSRTSTELLITGKVNMPYYFGLRLDGAVVPRRYAFGFIDSRDRTGNGSVGHGGGQQGVTADLKIYPKSGYVVVVLANVDFPGAGRISDYLDPRLPTS